jgi:hypothetical protein
MLFKWLLFFIPALAIELVCYILAPIVALFVTKRDRTDTVKRLNRAVVTMPREYIVKPLYWFQTHDNAVDEWWYGVYNTTHWFSFAREWGQAHYDNSWFVRYYCRVMWLWRNCAYGFHYNLFGIPVETHPKVYTKGIEEQTFWYELKIFKSYFHFEMQVPLLGKRYLSINIGWKSHKGIPKVLYANRIIGFRKYN